MDSILSTAVASLLVQIEAESNEREGANSGGLALVSQLLPRTIALHADYASLLSTNTELLAKAVAASLPDAIVAHLLCNDDAPSLDDASRGLISPLGCTAHAQNALRAAADASPAIGAWYRHAAKARCTRKPLFALISEPELLWETPFANNTVSPSHAITHLLSSLSCDDCAYSWLEPDGSDAQCDTSIGSEGVLSSLPPPRMRVATGCGRGAGVVTVMATCQPRLLPGALLRALRGVRPISLPAFSLDASALVVAPDLRALLPRVLVPVRAAGYKHSGSHSEMRCDLLVQLNAAAQEPNLALSTGAAQATSSAAAADSWDASLAAAAAADAADADAAATTTTTTLPWPSMAGYAAVKRHLEELVVLPVRAARVAAASLLPPSSSSSSPSSSSSQSSLLSPLLALSAAMRSLRVAPPRGLLMHGPSGCGKTAWARALAVEAGLRFLHIACPRLPSRYVGDSEAAVRAVFRAARAAAPCLLLLDDCQAIAGARAQGHVSADVDGEEADGKLDEVVQQQQLPAQQNTSVLPNSEDRDISGDDASKDDSISSHDSNEEHEEEEEEDYASTAPFASHLPSALAPSSSSPTGPRAPGAGPSSGSSGSSSGSVLDRMLATLLNEMDGVGLRKVEKGRPVNNDSTHNGDGNGGDGDDDDPLAAYVLVVGTTDRPGSLDPAVTRPGRLERHVYVGHPVDCDDVTALLAHATSGMALGRDVHLPSLAAELLLATAGPGATADIVRLMTPADISHGVTSAALAALQEATGTSYDDIATKGAAGAAAAATAPAGQEATPVTSSEADLCVSQRHLRTAFGLR